MIISLFVIESLLLTHVVISETQKSALCYLAYRPAPELLDFAQILAEDTKQYGVDIFIMVDDNKFNISTVNISSSVRLLQMSSETSLRHNYHKAINSGGTWRYLTSWDKTLLYFSVFNKNHSFVWFLEEDVFIPDVQVFRSIHQLYTNTSDLIVPRQELNLIGSDGLWRWIMASGKFIPPWACSMVNAVGFSRRMLAAMDRFVQWLGEVPFHEFFFNTLAVQLNFTIVTPTELSTIEYATVFFYKDVRRQPSNMWHPIKDYSLWRTWPRNLVNESTRNNRNFQLTDMHVLYQKNHTNASLQASFEDLFVRFETQKSRFPPITRPRWRQDFLDFAEECRKRNLSDEIIAFALKLADHAYKWPEPPVPELLKTKSAEHLRLEKEIDETKQAIYQFSSNGTTVTELRKQAIDLIKKLTYEIRREYFEEERLKNLTSTSSTSTSSMSSTTSTAISSSTTTTTSTTIRSSTFTSTSEKIRLKEEDRFDATNIKHVQVSISDRFKITTKVISIMCVSFIFILVSKWKNVQRRSSFKIFAILLILILICVAVFI